MRRFIPASAGGSRMGVPMTSCSPIASNLSYINLKRKSVESFIKDGGVLCVRTPSKCVALQMLSLPLALKSAAVGALTIARILQTNTSF